MRPILNIIYLIFLVSSSAVSADSMSEKKEVMIYELLNLAGNEKVMEQRVLNGAREVVGILKQSAPEIPDRIIEIFEEEMNKKIQMELKHGLPISDIFVKNYHENFTITEIEQLVEFYKSPVVQKLVGLSLAMKEKSSYEFNVWWQSLMPEIKKNVNLRLESEGLGVL